MIKLKSKEQIAVLREGGKRLARILNAASELAVPGAKAEDIDSFVREEMEKSGDKPAFLNYKPKGAKRGFPASVCFSVNDEIVHGIPNKGDRVLKEGDIVTLDAGLSHDGLITDMAVTTAVGRIDDNARDLVSATRNTLEKGILAARPGGRIGDISSAMERTAKGHGFEVVKELAGHGVGFSVHEEPFVPSYGKAGSGEKLRPGLVIAIEPILVEGKSGIRLGGDGFTYYTQDGKRAAQFEHTVAITEDGAEVLTGL